MFPNIVSEVSIRHVAMPRQALEAIQWHAVDCRHFSHTSPMRQGKRQDARACGRCCKGGTLKRSWANTRPSAGSGYCTNGQRDNLLQCFKSVCNWRHSLSCVLVAQPTCHPILPLFCGSESAKFLVQVILVDQTSLADKLKRVSYAGRGPFGAQ